jgi:hypothetical protein
MRFLSTVPWCLLQLSNHIPFIKHMMFYYLSRLFLFVVVCRRDCVLLTLFVVVCRRDCVLLTLSVVVCMRLLSWRRHQGTMLKNCILILPVSDPAKQAAQVVKHHVFDERNVIT